MFDPLFQHHPRRLFCLPFLLAFSSCLEAADPGPDYLSRLPSWEDFNTVSIPGSTPQVDRVAKFLVPARNDAALLPPVFQNAHRYQFHFEFLASVFPERFPGLTLGEYLNLVERRATRSYFAGTVTLYQDPARGGVFGFTLFVDGSEASELLEPAEVKGAYERLKSIFLTEVPGVPLEYAPTRLAEIVRARTWSNPGFPVYLAPSASPPDFLAYSRAVNYGRVRILTPTELGEAVKQGTIGWQDLLVLDDAPADIEAVCAGVLTAQPQGELSHLTIRLARRAVPNAYVRDARKKLEALSGKLVRLEVGNDAYSAREAEVAEAEVWWRDHRPNLRPIPAADLSYSGLDLLGQIPLDRGLGLSRFGGKAANLALFYSALPDEHETRGFAIPFSYYGEFLASNQRPSLADPGKKVSYAAYLEELLADEAFRTDGKRRREALSELRDRAETEGQVSPGLIAALRDRIPQVFGSEEVKVRFRSSSNAEDSLEFNGAGLYDSTSACLLDDLDGDEEGPSRCDSTKKEERTIARALKRVWMSLWSFEAFEEREYFQVDHLRSAMAILVTRAYPSEDLNGVAFTGNPSNRFDRSFTVNVQVGDASVVSPEPGVESEKDLLVMEGESVARILRARASSLVVPGAHVLSGEQAQLLGQLLARAAPAFLDGLDLGGHARDEVLVDVELKIQDGQLIIKQARPFLVADPSPAGPTLHLEMPRDLTASGLWLEYRDPADEYRLKCRLELQAFRLELPLRAGPVSAPIVRRLQLGPGAEVLEPLEGGLLRVGPAPWQSGPGLKPHVINFDQRFRAGSRILKLELTNLVFTFEEGGAAPLVVIDEAALESFLPLTAAILDESGEIVDNLRFGLSEYPSLPLWEVSVDLGADGQILFHERYREPFAGSGPANLVRAEATIDGRKLLETSYWRLIYAADHHNWNEEMELVLDPPLELFGLGPARFLHTQEGFDVIPAKAALLDAERNVLKEWARPRRTRIKVSGPLPGAFRRGETNRDDKIDLADAVTVLSWLFAGGAPPACADAADVDDNGRIEITDAVSLLGFLFLGGRAPVAPGPVVPGFDDTGDTLPPCEGGP